MLFYAAVTAPRPMHAVTVLAQPRRKKPLLSRKTLKRGRYEARKRGTFGVLWFTNFGQALWETMHTIDPEVQLKLRHSGFDEMDWTLSFRLRGFKARLTASRYKGRIGVPRNCYLELKLGAANPNDLRNFMQELANHFKGKVKRPPWDFNRYDKLAETTGQDREAILKAWEEAMGTEIKPPEKVRLEKPKKKWSLFGRKGEAKADTEDDIEVMVDEDGDELHFRNLGTLEVDDIEYAVMEPAEQIPGEPREINIFSITRDAEGAPTYAGIENEELFDQLAEYAEEYIEELA